MIIYINSIQWEIILTSNPYLLSINGDIHLGVTDKYKQTIYLYNNLPDILFRKVLLHELTHAYLFSYDHYLNLSDEEFLCSFIDKYSDEIISQTDHIMTTIGSPNLA